MRKPFIFVATITFLLALAHTGCAQQWPSAYFIKNNMGEIRCYRQDSTEEKQLTGIYLLSDSGLPVKSVIYFDRIAYVRDSIITDYYYNKKGQYTRVVEHYNNSTSTTLYEYPDTNSDKETITNNLRTDTWIYLNKKQPGYTSQEQHDNGKLFYKEERIQNGNKWGVKFYQRDGGDGVMRLQEYGTDYHNAANQLTKSVLYYPPICKKCKDPSRKEEEWFYNEEHVITKHTTFLHTHSPNETSRYTEYYEYIKQPPEKHGVRMEFEK